MKSEKPRPFAFRSNISNAQRYVAGPGARRSNHIPHMFRTVAGKSANSKTLKQLLESKTTVLVVLTPQSLPLHCTYVSRPYRRLPHLRVYQPLTRSLEPLPTSTLYPTSTVATWDELVAVAGEQTLQQPSEQPSAGPAPQLRAEVSLTSFRGAGW